MNNAKKGSRIGPYKIVELLPGGKGGMSRVYQGLDPERQVGVALKVSRIDSTDPRFNSALKREVDILRLLNHPGVVRLETLPLADSRQERSMARALELAGGPWFYAMEYLQGGSLNELLDRMGLLPFPLSCAIATRLVDTLEYLHSHDIAHLDVKPENVLFRHKVEKDAPIEPVLIDFGVAARTKTPRTTGGSLHTMAPEHLRQARGELPPETPLDVKKMDIYSLGVVTYRMWTATYPFGGITANRITSAVLSGVIQPPTAFNPQLPMQVESLMTRWLAKDPQSRPTLEELKNYLYYWSQGTDHFPELVRKKPVKGKKKWWLFWKN